MTTTAVNTEGPTAPPTVVAVIVGTRPEAVKVAPVVLAMRERRLPVRVVDTGQQPGRVDEALRPFGLEVADVLGVERADGTLPELVGQSVTRAAAWMQEVGPAAVLVQGDTTTAFAAAFTASMQGRHVVHLEAGLRTGDPALPFPEEINRMLIADVATLHLAPTPLAAAALAREGIAGEHVVVTGNTVVDALETLLPAAQHRPLPPALDDVANASKVLTVTVHRREAWGEGVRSVAAAVADLLDEHPELVAAVVTHPNPAVAADVRDVLGGTERCLVVDPLPYDDMLALLARSTVILTDSGGIQEEAPSLRVPCVVARSVTERAEGLEAGWVDLVGLHRSRIVEAVSARLAQPGIAVHAPNPYGDGRAAGRVTEAVLWHLGRGPRPSDWPGAPRD